MRNFLFNSALLIFCLISVTGNSFAAENIGRLFTTPGERKTLDQLRKQDTVEITVPEIITDEPDEEDTYQPEGITVNGLVYRKGGKSTAWINESNTYEGNLATQYLDIDSEDINPQDVRIRTPDNTKSIRVKTGQTYDPVEDRVVDLLKDD